MTIEINDEYGVTFDFDYKKILEDVVAQVIDSEDFPFEAEVSVTFVDEPTIQEINLQNRDIDKVTDVLSFPMIDYPSAGDFSQLEDNDDNFNIETGEAILGDIVLCIPKIFSQAEDYGHSVKREYAFLIAHSMLHLLGYDHMSPEEERVMFGKQEAVLGFLNISRDK